MCKKETKQKERRKERKASVPLFVAGSDMLTSQREKGRAEWKLIKEGGGAGSLLEYYFYNLGSNKLIITVFGYL